MREPVCRKLEPMRPGALTPQLERENPHAATREKPTHHNKYPTQPKENQNKSVLWISESTLVVYSNLKVETLVIKRRGWQKRNSRRQEGRKVTITEEKATNRALIDSLMMPLRSTNSSRYPQPQALVLVCLGCHNKGPQTGWLKQQKCIASQF